MPQNRIKKQIGKTTRTPADRIIELNEFLKKHNLKPDEPKHERI